MRNILVTLLGKVPLTWIKAISRLQWRHPLLRRGFGFVSGLLRAGDGVIQQGAGKGLRFNAGRANAGYLLGSSEPGVQRALVALVGPGMNIFDIGANVGFLSVIAARLVGGTGKVISFEPVPENARQLGCNLALNDFHRVTIRAEALGNIDGTAQFQMSERPTWGKLASSGSSVAEPAGEISVPVRRLDSIMDEMALPAPDLMKIDVEGAEEDVLLGAKEVIRKHRPLLMIELHGTNQAIDRLLGAYDYSTIVLGSRQCVVDSPWDAYIVAVPSESMDVLEAVSVLADSGLPRR